MKKLFAALLVLALAFTGCAMAETLSVIATPSPHAEVVRLIEEDLDVYKRQARARISPSTPPTSC